MWRLFISDLRNRWLDWVGIILVAFFCGVASGWSALLISSSYGLEGAASRQLLNAGTATLFLTWIASIPVSASVARLVAKKKEPSYSVWRLLGMRRRYVGLCFFVQIAIASFLGLMLGFIAFGFAIPCFDVFVCLGACLDFPVVALVACVELLAFVLGGLSSVHSSLNVSPLLTLGGQLPYRKKIGAFRIVVCALLVVGLFSLIAISVESDPLARISCLVFLPFVVALFCSVVLRPLLPWVVKTWTAVAPWRGSPVWLVAQSKVLFYSDESVAIQMPIAIGISLVAGLIAVVDALVVYLRGQGIEASGISTEQLLSFLGAPILVCVAGAVAVVAMTANVRVLEGRTFISCGSSHRSIFEMMICESFIHAFNALIVGMACALSSGAIASAVCSVSLPLSACLVSSLLIFAPSFAVVLSPMLMVLPSVSAGKVLLARKAVE